MDRGEGVGRESKIRESECSIHREDTSRSGEEGRDVNGRVGDRECSVDLNSNEEN